MEQRGASLHPVLAAYVYDLEYPIVAVGHWLSNRHGDAIATRAYPLESLSDLEAMLASAAAVDRPSPAFLRAFVGYRQSLVAAQQRLSTVSAWIDGQPYRLVDTGDAQGRLLISEAEWTRAPGEAALFLADWAPDGSCPIATTDLWRSGLRRRISTTPGFDPQAQLPRLVQRAFVRAGDPDHPFRPDLAAISADNHGDGPALLLTRACGDDWADGYYREAQSFAQAIYWVANHSGDVRREPFAQPAQPFGEAHNEVRRIVDRALAPMPSTTDA